MKIVFVIGTDPTRDPRFKERWDCVPRVGDGVEDPDGIVHDVVSVVWEQRAVYVYLEGGEAPVRSRSRD